MNHARLVDDIVQAARPALADVVVTASLRGLGANRLAIVLERRFDGRVSLRFGPRSELITVAADPRIAARERHEIADALLRDEPDVPVVVLVEMEGYFTTGVRRLATTLPS